MSGSPKRALLVVGIILLLGVIISLGFIRIIHQINPTPLANQAGRASASPTRLPSTPIPSPTPTQAALSIQGTQIVDVHGNAVTLIGASRPSLEYSCSGDGHFQLADFQAMRSWGMNAVRIPLSSEFWANGGNACPNYHLTVTAAVANAEAAGLYVILTLQWNAPLQLSDDPTIGGGQYPMPDAGQDVTFWQDLATIYHSDPAVLFDLLGEPHDISWNTWLNGGQITTQVLHGNQFASGQGTYQAIGMADLVAKVRAIAPDNIIIVSGMDWGYDLADVNQGYSIQARNILYSTHPFDYSGKEPGNWPQDFGNLSQQVAVIAAEFGAYNCQTGYISTAISYFNQHHISWLAWAWNVSQCSDPSLLADWSGRPNTPYGEYIRQQMLAVHAGGA